MGEVTSDSSCVLCLMFREPVMFHITYPCFVMVLWGWCKGFRDPQFANEKAETKRKAQTSSQVSFSGFLCALLHLLALT